MYIFLKNRISTPRYSSEIRGLCSIFNAPDEDISSQTHEWAIEIVKNVTFVA